MIVLSPLFLAVALCVALFLGRPVLFRQPRLGRFGETFEIVKFRSMTDDRDALGNLLPNDQRVTRFGTFLRGTSLDELPELTLVLAGKMSLVGPRPLLAEYLGWFTDRELTRLDARPGITGLAQTSGRNTVDWDNRLELDVQYVERQSLGLDLAILARTAWKVLRRDGVEAVPSESKLSDVRRAQVESETVP